MEYGQYNNWGFKECLYMHSGLKVIHRILFQKACEALIYTLSTMDADYMLSGYYDQQYNTQYTPGWSKMHGQKL